MAAKRKPLKVRVAQVKASKKNTDRTRHLVAESLTVECGELRISLAGDDKIAGLWVNHKDDPLHGVAIYQQNGQGVVGIRRGTAEFGAALTVDADNMGCIQLRKSSGEFITITADELGRIFDK